MANGGPWGGNRGGNGGGGPQDDDRPPQDRRPPRRPGEGPPIPEIDQLVNRGREQLRVLMGGRGGNVPPAGRGGDGLPSRTILIGAAVVAVLLWAWLSFYRVQADQRSVELFLGDYSSTGEPGLNFAPWPFVTAEVVNVTTERTESIGASAVGSGQTGGEQGAGLMLTTDANIVDIGFQVVWNVSDPAKMLFNIANPELTVRAVSESVMREVIAASNLSPILNRDRGLIAETVKQGIQSTLDAYDSGINIVRVNLDRADPPAEVIDAFRDVQAAEQERDLLQRQADAYANRALAEARGQAAQILEQAEAYRAQTVNDALGQASRFTSVLGEYRNAPDVTRERIYLETMEQVLGDVSKIILDPAVAGGEGGGSGVVPFLPLDQLMRQGGTPQGAAEGAVTAPPAAATSSANTTASGN